MKFSTLNLICFLIMNGLGLYGQEYKLPYNLSVNAYDIYSEQGKIKSYIIDSDDEHIYYVTQKSEALYALVSDCASCQSLPINQVLRIQRKGSSKSWLVGLGMTTLIGGVLASTGDAEESRGRWALGVSIGYYGGIICIAGAVIQSFRKSTYDYSQFRSFSLSYQKKLKEMKSIQDFRVKKIGKKKPFTFYVKNYTASIIGYVVASDENSITVVENKKLYNNLDLVNEENSLRILYTDINYVK